MVTPGTLLTEDDLLHMPDDGFRYELIEGELRQMSPAGFEHGLRTNLLSRLLSVYVADHDLGYVLAAETGFVIARTPDGRATVRAADVSFVAKNRIPPTANLRKFLELAPDLVVETISPDDTDREVTEKIEMWLKCGVRLAVTIDPDSESIQVYRSMNDVTRLTEADELSLEPVVPGFRCRVAEIFA